LLDYMRAGIDCVAVTDHNSGAWVDLLKKALAELEEERREEFRHLYLFPGVELSVQGGVHLLAILDQEKTTADINSLLGAVQFTGTKGRSDAVTQLSYAKVVREVEAAGGIAIPAHVDTARGLSQLSGETLKQALEAGGVFAMEVVDPAWRRPDSFTANARTFTEVVGSDAHHRPGGRDHRVPGSRFTWIKMGTPSLEGLKLALLDGPLSVRRSDTHTGDPNRHAPLVLESIEVAGARFVGRESPFRLDLNPWLNAIVGGRGSGKSTLVEFLRLALRREGEIPPALTEELGKYGQVYRNREDPGLLTEEAQIRVIYRKNGSRFRVQWSPSGQLDAIEETGDDGWRRAEGVVETRFPVRIFSQKQIFHMAGTPMALLKVVDDAPEVDRRAWDARWEEEEARFRSLRTNARELEAGLAEESQLRGELDDVKRKLALFEEAGHAGVLRAFQTRQRQTRAVELWDETWRDAGERIRALAEALVPEPLADPTLDPNTEVDRSLLEAAARARTGLEGLRRSLEVLSEQADSIRGRWENEKADTAWRAAADDAVAAYHALGERLATEGAGHPAAYGEMVQRHQAIEQRLGELESRRSQVQSLRKQAEASLARLLDIRRDITSRREAFLDEVLATNPHVRIRVLPYGARETVEPDLRRILQKDDESFRPDIGGLDGGGLVGIIYGKGNARGDIEAALGDVRQRVRDIASGEHGHSTLADRRFANHLARLVPEAMDRLDAYFPEDSLEVEYSPTADGQRFQSIRQGSPGQKTAALLAFLLSYGDEPLVLDQPEDDLDNRLIYDLIVKQLREAKLRRQIIVVTHNANIVVNGDAELVVGLVARGGETRAECVGSLQEKQVRGTICAVMEGGQEAFQQRYRRIALEDRHV